MPTYNMQEKLQIKPKYKIMQKINTQVSPTGETKQSITMVQKYWLQQGMQEKKKSN